jgi:hypothetical protein
VGISTDRHVMTYFGVGADGYGGVVEDGDAEKGEKLSKEIREEMRGIGSTNFRFIYKSSPIKILHPQWQ